MPSPSATLRVFLVEDDAGHAQLIRRNLSRVGVAHNLQHFVDGNDFLDFLDTLKDDELGHKCLVLLDIHMPGIDGIDVLRRIKADPRFAVLPVIMLSTTDDPGEIQRCHELGCSNYLTKPIDHRDFANTMRQLGLFLTIVHLPLIPGVPRA